MISKREQSEEIVHRQKGKIDDLIGFIDQDIHVCSILAISTDDSQSKSINNQRAIQLVSLKNELQIALVKYNKENDKDNDKIQ